MFFTVIIHTRHAHIEIHDQEAELGHLVRWSNVYKTTHYGEQVQGYLYRSLTFDAISITECYLCHVTIILLRI
jgi:hypothetical protein